MRKSVNRIGQIHPGSVAAVLHQRNSSMPFNGPAPTGAASAASDIRARSARSFSSCVRTAVRNSLPCSYSAPLLSMRRTNGYRPSLPLYLSFRFVARKLLKCRQSSPRRIAAEPLCQRPRRCGARFFVEDFRVFDPRLKVVRRCLHNRGRQELRTSSCFGCHQPEVIDERQPCSLLVDT